MNRPQRAVITGIGILAPNGIGLTEFWQSLLECRSGIGPVTLFDATGFKTRVAGEVKGFDPLDYIEAEQKPKRMARHTQLAYAAAMMALRDARLDPDDLNFASPTPVIIGVSTSAIEVIESVFRTLEKSGPNRAPVTSLSSSSPQAAANTIADRIGSFAHAATVSSACPSGLDAVASAVDMITNGEAEIAIAGGADAPITPLAMSSFIASGIVSNSNGEPDKASRPFDRNRQNGVLSEGACVFVIENAQCAAARGATAYLEITGYARRRDPDAAQPGCGLVESMSLALANACSPLEDVDYICAYGPSDRFLDAAEVRFIKEVFGERAYHIPVTSIKGVTGNPLAAGGPFQVATCAMSMRDQLIAPTANFESGDDDCDLDFVPTYPRKAKVDCALINVRGLGGGASSMVVQRYLN
jgi:3-oxoacyl-[acyl-carrier-protein] synthase II